MKNVLSITPYSYLPWFSGGQKSIAEFLEFLGEKVELTVVSVNENDFSLAKNYQAVPLLKKSFARYYDRSLVGKITRLVKEKGIDTIICEHPYFAWLCFAVKRKTGVRVIIHVHNIEYQRFKSTGRWWWPVLKRYEKSSLKKADALIIVSPDDRDFLINEWKIPREKCLDRPYGIDFNKNPEDKTEARNHILTKYSLDGDTKLFLFAGLLKYKPNLEAMNLIIEKVNPELLKYPGYKYKILICGKGLPEEFDNLSAYADKNIIYAGFVEDISVYYKGADVFLNAVLSGGGVKTKVIEAIAAGTTVVSTNSGAVGVEKEITGRKLEVVDDNRWEQFAAKVVEKAAETILTPQDFYEQYYSGNIINRLLKELDKT